jgi:hypothetical protein
MCTAASVVTASAGRKNRLGTHNQLTQRTSRRLAIGVVVATGNDWLARFAAGAPLRLRTAAMKSRLSAISSRSSAPRARAAAWPRFVHLTVGVPRALRDRGLVRVHDPNAPGRRLRPPRQDRSRTGHARSVFGRGRSLHGLARGGSDRRTCKSGFSGSAEWGSTRRLRSQCRRPVASRQSTSVRRRLSLRVEAGGGRTG